MSTIPVQEIKGCVDDFQAIQASLGVEDREFGRNCLLGIIQESTRLSSMEKFTLSQEIGLAPIDESPERGTSSKTNEVSTKTIHKRT